MAMERKSSKMSRLALIGITLLILVVPFGLYYSFYVSSQRAFFTKRSHRILSSIGSQVVSRVDGLQKVVRYAASRRCGDPGIISDKDNNTYIRDLAKYFDARSPFGIKLQFDQRSPESEADATKLEGRTDLPISVEFRQVGSAHRLTLNYLYGDQDREEDPCSDEGSKKELFKPGRFSVSSDTGELLRPVVERLVRHERRNAGEDLFDKVLVADSDTGAIIFEEGMDEVRIVNLDELLGKGASGATKHKSVAGRAAEEGSEDRSDDKTSDTKQQNDSTTSQKPSEDAGRQGLGVSAVSETEVASGEYKLLVQPIQLTVARSDSKTNQGYKLTVCGLVRSSTFSDKTFSFPYSLLLGFILVVLLTALSVPLIKLKLLGPKDDLRKADVVRTAGSAFLGIALLTLTLLDGHGYLTLEGQLDDQLALLATDIDRNLRSELAGVADELDALNLDKTVADDLEAACEACSQTQQSREDILDIHGVVDPGASTYPYFNSAIWMATESGEQKIKYTTRSEQTAFINVSGRRFFKDAKAKKLWLISVPQHDPLSLCLEPLNSRTSGENVAVVSKLTPRGDFVSAVDTRLMSLYGPVLPAGYGFCVIDSSGLVLFHSDEVKNLEENFFEECNNNKNLRAAVLTRQQETVDTKYVGRAYRVLVTPIQDLPWTLAVFRNTEILGTTNLEIVTLTVIAFSAWSLLLVVGIALAFWFRSKPWLPGLWPDGDKLECYKRVLFVNCALFIVFLLLVTFDRGGWLIAWGLIFPILAILHLLLLFEREPTKPTGETPGQEPTKPTGETPGQEQTGPLSKISRRIQTKVHEWLADFRRTYVLALVSLLVLAGMAPTVAFFKLFRDKQVGIFLRNGQLSLARGLERREEAVRSHYSSLLGSLKTGAVEKQARAVAAAEEAKATGAASGADARELTRLADDAAAAKQAYAEAVARRDFVSERTEWFIFKRLRLRWDVYESFFFGTEWIDTGSRGAPTGQEGRGSPDNGPLAWFLTTFSPLYNETGVDTAWLARGKSYDNHWESPEKSDRLTLVLRSTTSRTTGEDKDKNEEHTWALASITPTVTGVAMPLWWLLLFLTAMMLVLCYVVARFAARRLLLLDLETPISKSDIPAPDNRNFLVISPPPLDHKNVLEGNPDRTVDLSKTSAEQWWKEEIQLSKLHGSTVLIDHFEFYRDDPFWNERKLRLVENLLSDGNHVRIMSAVDPLSFPLTRTQRASESSVSNAEPNSQRDVERWAVTLASFVRRFGFDQTDSRTDPAQSVTPNAPGRGPVGRELADELVAKTGDRAEAYYRAVWSTCSPGERLTLCQVAQYGLVSRFDPDLRGLMQKGLIRCKPSPLMNPSFRRFVIGASAAEGVLAYRAEVESSWEKWKVPMLLVLLGVIAFLFATQRDLFDSTLTLASAVTGGILAFLRLVGMFSRDKTGAT